jgi:hypothetical protein
MTECQRCAGKSQLFLCGPCQADLRDMLLGLAQGQILPTGQRGAGWLEYLEDAALGRTRLGESARCSTERNTPLPFHLGASQLLSNVHAMLVRWVQDLCESRGVEVPV